MSKPMGAAVAGNAAAKAVAGAISYQQQDCQAFVEGCVRDCGGGMAYRGSNDMFRNACTWLGTVKEAKALGRLVPGALLFIHAFDGGEPSAYRADGKGNASHVGLYCGLDGAEAAHSSASRGRVATSTLKNGWTHAGWAKEIDYGSEGERVATVTMRATVVSTNGEPVKLRSTPDTSRPYLAKVPVGTAVEVLEAGGQWCTVTVSGQRGYMMRQFLELEGAEDGPGAGVGLEDPKAVAALLARVEALEAWRASLEAGDAG